MSALVWLSSEAQQEISEAAAWYESRQSGLGRQFVAAVTMARTQIAEAPFRAPLWTADDPARRFVMRRFPYVVLYDVEERGVLILAVAHTRRNPGYWKGRR